MNASRRARQNKQRVKSEAQRVVMVLFLQRICMGHGDDRQNAIDEAHDWLRDNDMLPHVVGSRSD